MAPPSMASMPLMGIRPQVSNDSVIRSFGQEQKRSAVSAAAATIPGSINSKSATAAETPLSSEAVENTKVFSSEEIAKHRNENDAWIVVDGKVYDVTQFLESHPGGQELILDHLHKSDAGDIMRGKEGDEGHSHSKAAFKMLQQFQIGSVENANGLPTDESMKKGTSDKKNYTVDLTRPLVAQVGYLGADYDDWVHDPVVCKESPRFFESDISEAVQPGKVVVDGIEGGNMVPTHLGTVIIIDADRVDSVVLECAHCTATRLFFTRTRWWVIPLIWVPISLQMEVLALKHGVSYVSLPFLMVIGGLIWTFLEYILHRFLFHMKTSSFWGNTIHYVIHGFHHKHPMDGARLVFPPAFTAVICISIWVVLGNWLFAYHLKLAMYGGALLTYVIYDLTHYFLHFGTAFSEQSRKMKRYHLNHHFKDQTNGYGITTTVWDAIFGTMPDPKVSQD